MSKEYCLSSEWFPHDIMELILVKLPVRSLVRFRSVSKQWKSTIESRHFQERQLIYSQNSRDPIILMIDRGQGNNGLNIEELSTSVFESSAPFNIPTPREKTIYNVCPTSCDGLICFYNFNDLDIVIVNPATRFHRSFPPPSLQKVIRHTNIKNRFILRLLGFGKDKLRGTYKLVLLVNSSELGLENVTACEVFDFSTKAWKYITRSSPLRITNHLDPVYVDGWLHWFTECKTRITSLDLHTETFHLISKVPFSSPNWDGIGMCNLDNRLCVSEKERSSQVMWSFDSCNKTWEKMYLIDLNRWLFGKDISSFSPLALLERKKKKNKLLFSSIHGSKTTMGVHDPDTKSDDVVFKYDSVRYPYHDVCYFESLVSIL